MAASSGSVDKPARSLPDGHSDRGWLPAWAFGLNCPVGRCALVSERRAHSLGHGTPRKPVAKCAHISRRAIQADVAFSDGFHPGYAAEPDLIKHHHVGG